MFTYATRDCHPAPTATPKKIYQKWSHSQLSFFVMLNCVLIITHQQIPDKTGWRLFKRTVKPNKTAILVVSAATASLEVKRWGKLSFVAKTTIMHTTPIRVEVMETTITENFARDAFPAPSSFDTLTLITPRDKCISSWVFS